MISFTFQSIPRPTTAPKVDRLLHNRNYHNELRRDLRQGQASVDTDREFSIVDTLCHRGEGGVQVLLLRELQACLDHGAKHLACNRAHVRLGCGELGDDMLKDELLHVTLNIGVAHYERSQSRCHVQGAVALRSGRLTACSLSLYVHIEKDGVRTPEGLG